MLVGRQVELRRLTELADRVRVGNGGAVLVEGEAGIGKTSLLDALVASVGADIRTVRMVGRESEAEFSYGALRDVWKGFDAANPTSEPYAVARATLTALADRAKQNPLLVIIDDLHWVDRGSVQALLFAARRIERDRVAIIGAFRPHVGHPIDTGGLERITLDGLDAASAATLLTTDYPDLAASVVGEIIERTSGNPLAMREVARALHPRQRSAARPIGAVLPVGSEIYRRVRRRMRQLSAEAQTTVLAVAADPTGHRRVVEAACNALGIDEAEVAEGFAAEFIVVEATRIDFTHPLARSAVYGGASMSDRRRVHQALAAVSNDHEQQVWHRAAAVRGPDERVAAELEHLAMAAIWRGDLSGAAHAWERAALVGAPGDTRAGRYLAAAAAASRCGLTVDPLVAGVLETTTDDALRADAHIIQAMAYGWQGRHVELAALAEKEVPLLADVDPLRAAILLSVSVTDQWYQLKTAASGEQAAEAWALAGQRLHDSHPFGVAPAVFACFVSAVRDGFDDALFKACRDAVFDGRGFELATPLVWSYVVLERLDDAVEFIDRADRAQP